MTISNGFSLLTELGNFASTNGGEIPAFDALSKRLFVVAGAVVEILDLSDPTNPLKISDLALDASGLAPGFELVPNSVAVGKAGTPSAGIVAVALAVRDGFNNQQPGQVQFFDTTTGAFLDKVTVGFLPDMVVFSPDSTKVLSADEGEANEDYTIDPVGSVSIINLNAVDLSNSTVQRAGFESFNAQQAALEAAGVRIFGPNATVAQDLEPEYITFNGDGTKAWVTLQENNAIAVVDIATGTIESILPLGLKDHSLAGNGLDASDRDVDGSSDAGGKINIQNWPVFGLYQPDSIASFSVNGLTYYVTANEGDTRVRPTDDDLLAGVDEGDIFNEETRLGDSAYILDPTVFPDAATLKLNENLGRLTVTTASGDIDGDGDFDQIVVPGARSFSIWDSNGTLVYDSGDDFEQITARVLPTFFNASNDNNSFDNRSDNKGPEPEGLAIGKVGARTYAFIGLERIGGVMAYDVTVPTAPAFVQYINTRDFTADPETNVTDSGPEGLTFIAAEDSPNGKPLLVVSNEVSQTTNIFEVTPPPFTLELFHFSDQEPLNAGAGLSDITGLSAVLNALKAEDLGNDGLADNTLILSSGDAIIPGLFYEASLPAFGSRGIADIQIQNELGVQAIAFGNHEFDFGTKAIADLISGAAPGEILGADFAGANFPYLSTNLDFATDANLAPLEIPGGQAPQANKVTSSTVIEVNGEKIGVVGATTPTLATISNPGTVGISPSPFGSNPTEAELDALAAIIQAEVDALLAANPDMNKVVLLAHMQKLAIEEALAIRLENVDIIVGGGSNTRLFDENDRVRAGDSDQGEYPKFFTNAGGTQTLLVNTDGSYKYLGRLVIDFDADGNIIPESYDAEISGAYATDAQGVADLNATGLVDPEIQQIVDAIETEIVATEANVFGLASVFLNGNRSGQPTDGVRTQETNLGNLTADANLALAQAIDPTVVVSIKNGGGIRASIGQTIVPPGGTEAVRLPNSELLDSQGNVVKPEGGISENDIKTTLAFNNGLSLLTVTKSELVALLEHGVAGLPSAAGQFPQVAGVKFSFDPDLPAGDRLLSAGIFDEDDQLVAELLRDGEIVGDANQTFRIVTLGFLADGGDNYPFPTGDGINRVDLTDLNGDGVADNALTGDATFAFDGTEQDALAEYLVDNFATTPFAEADVEPTFDERIQNLNFRADSVLPEVDTGAGNHVIFIHPDGTSPSHFAFARFVDHGPDGRLNWDMLEKAGVYLGHMEDQLGGTSNGGAVTHATGAKVYAESFGFEAGNTPIASLNGSNQTIVESAIAANKVTALVQSGAIFEPGTAAFVAKTEEIINPDGSRIVPRAQSAEIARQVIESGVDFIMGGGELNLLPVGTDGFHGTAAELDALSTSSLVRPTENLIDLAESLGYTVVYTEAQLNALLELPTLPTKVLGVFAPIHTFNDRSEEQLAANNLPLYLETAPTIAEMLDVTQRLMEAHPNFDNGSITIMEEEGTDNFGNNNNASGMLEALRRTDAAIGVAMEFVERYENTLIITAADSDAGGLQVRDPLGTDNVGNINNNPIDSTSGRNVPMDGQNGVGTAPFTSAPDANGDQFNFAIGWAGLPDFSGSIVSKAHGLNADKLPATLDNTKIYELMYETLFDTELEARNEEVIAEAPAATAQTGNVIFIHPDGTSPSHFMALRNIDLGPDGRLNWDQMTNAGVYLGHMENQLTGTSNAGAVTHANGVKVFNESFGLNEDNSPVTPASGKVGYTILEEAIAAGKGTALIQSGHIGEPGTAAFAAATTNRDGDNIRARDKTAEIAEQVIRSGTQIIMAGGEVYLLPQGTTGFHVTPEIDAEFNDPVDRPTTNLITLAQSLGYTVVYTEDQMNAAVANATASTKLLGVFAANHTFDDRREESLGLNTDNPLPLYVETAPTVAEMLQASLQILRQDPDGFFVVVEEEGTDNFGNNNNAVGTIEGLRRADAAIGVAMDFVDTQDPNTLVLTAADSDAGGMQVYQFAPYARPSGNFDASNPNLADEQPEVPFINVNRTTTNNSRVYLDGPEGSTATEGQPWTSFSAQDSIDGPMGNFGIAWVGTPDFPGSIVSKAYGMNADLLPSTLDNTEIYNLMYQTLFGVDPDTITPPEPPTLPTLVSVGTPGDDVVIAGVDGFAGSDNLVFTGAGDDEVDTAAGGEMAGNNRLFSGSGADSLFVNNGDRLQAGSGNDEIDATDARGYRVAGGLGNDIFYLGQEGRAIGGAGDDQFYVGEGGGNFITGGAGADQFWLLTDDPALLTMPNTVLDFSQGSDVIGIANQEADFGDLMFSGNTIALGDITFATLVGVDTSTLTAADFAFI